MFDFFVEDTLGGSVFRHYFHVGSPLWSAENGIEFGESFLQTANFSLTVFDSLLQPTDTPV